MPSATLAGWLLGKEVIVHIGGEVIRGGRTTAQRFTVPHLLDIAQTAGDTAVPVGVEGVEVDGHTGVATGIDLGAVQDGLHGAVHDLGRGGAVGVDEVISAFDSKVKTAYQSVLNRMVGFVNDFLDMSETVHKDVNLIRAIVDLVQQDQTIKAGDEFFIGQNGEKKKKATLGDLKEVCLPSFLLGVWHFIVVNRKDNGIGKATYDVWCPSAGGGQRKYVAHMGEGILESLTISYADIVEEAETDAEPVETVIIGGTSEQQVQQTVNNPFVFNFNQYGNNGTQIGHIENYYGSKKKED